MDGLTLEVRPLSWIVPRERLAQFLVFYYHVFGTGLCKQSNTLNAV